MSAGKAEDSIKPLAQWSPIIPGSERARLEEQKTIRLYHEQQQKSEQPQIPGPLNTTQKLQAYLDSCPPNLTELDLRAQQITSLAGVRFPPGLKSLLLNLNNISSLVRSGLIGLFSSPAFFRGLESMVGRPAVAQSSNFASIFKKTDDLNKRTDEEIKRDRLTNSEIAPVLFPPGLEVLELRDNRIESLEGVLFPDSLKILTLDNNDIKSLQGVQFPPQLEVLDLNINKIDNLYQVKFPVGLKELNLSDNNILHLTSVEFPPNIEEFTIDGNPLEDVAMMIRPNKTVIEHLKKEYSSLYFRDIYDGRAKLALKDAKQREKALTRQSQQTEQATLKQISDFNQQSTQNQLRGITSFLREGMEARAKQHAEQLEREGEERGKLLIYIRLTANRMRYPVPLNATETVQSVLDYINEHYYVSSLVPNCGAIYLYKSGIKDLLLLTTTRILADYNIKNGDILIAECRNIQMNGGGINHVNKKYTMKTRKIKNKNKNKNLKTKKGWSLKYKRSIDCKRPRGFSQRQYCNYGRKKS